MQGSHELSYLKELTESLIKRDSELWERDRLIKLVFENCPADLVIWAVDIDMTFTLSAGPGLKRLGKADNEVIGQTLFEYFETDDSNLLPIQKHQECLKGITVNFDFTWEGRVWHTHCAPLIDIKGNITGVTGCAFDITTYIEQTEKIKELEKIIACNKSCNDTKMKEIKKML